MRHLVKEAVAEAIVKRDKKGIRLRPIEPKETKRSSMPFAFGEPEEVEAWWDAYKEMREQQVGALRALARPLGKTVFWPEGSHRPPTIRAAAEDLANELAAKAVPG